MTKYISLLRGVNVSGKNKIKMADLRAELDKTSLSNVQTYIQSGNIIYEADHSENECSDLINQTIQIAFGLDVPVLTLSQEYIQQVLSQNPFVGKGIDTKKLYFCFLFEEPDDEQVVSLSTFDVKGDEYVIRERMVYTCYHKGAGQSKLDNNFIEKKLKVKATMRNWRTTELLSNM